MFKNYFLLTIFILCTASLFAQKADDIIESQLYIYGIGEADNYQKADKNALDDLISKISVEVQSEFENLIIEEDGDFREYTKSVVKTYSNINIDRTQNLIVKEKKNYVKVMRFIKKKDLDNIFIARKNKIRSYTSLGIDAFDETRIGDALMNYYWGYALLRSHPDFNKIDYRFGDDEYALMLITALRDRINSVLSSIDIEISKIITDTEKDRKTIILNITSNGFPVQNLDYRYFTGTSYSSIISVRDGLGIVELTGESSREIENVRIKIEYEYFNKSHFDPEVYRVLESLDIPYFQDADFSVALKREEFFIEEETVDSSEVVLNQETINYDASGEYEEDIVDYRKITGVITTAITDQNHSEIIKYFTPEGYDMYLRLIAEGDISIIEKDSLQVIRLKNETMVRAIPLFISYPGNSRKFIENLVLIFNEDGQIDAITFSLGDVAVKDITSKSRWSVEDKYQLLKFMELYKTAYCLKRIDYIESIFAEDALIIVGNVLQKAEPIDGMYQIVGDEKVSYIKHSKQSYIEKLGRVFSSNEIVNIHFEKNKVRRTNNKGEKIYGIQIAQHYYSSNYADKGYLFLMIDMKDSLNPRIYVRTWQPKMNEDGSVYGLSDFHY